MVVPPGVIGSGSHGSGMVCGQDTQIIVAEVAALAVISFKVVHNYAMVDMDWIPFLAAYVGTTLSLTVLALVHFDIVMVAAAGADHECYEVLYNVWALVYWTTFVLGMFVFPVMLTVETLEGYSACARFRMAWWSTMWYYKCYLMVGSIASVPILVWIFFNKGVSGLGSISAWCIALSNLFGMLRLVVLMSFGLVGLPFHLWELADPARMLHKGWVAAEVLHPVLDASVCELEELIDRMQSELNLFVGRRFDRSSLTSDADFLMGRSASSFSGDAPADMPEGPEAAKRRDASASFKVNRFTATRINFNKSVDLLDEVMGKLNRPWSSLNVRIQRNSVYDVAPGSCRHLRTAPPTSEEVWELHLELLRARFNVSRTMHRWLELLRSCEMYSALDHGQPGTVGDKLAEAWWPCTRCAWIRACMSTSFTRWLVTFRSPVLKAFGYTAAALSFAIVLGQLTMFSWTGALSPLLVLHPMLYLAAAEHDFVVAMVIMMPPLMYMACTACWSMERLKIIGWYGVYSNHLTDATSLLWYVSVLMKIVAPLCYHFLFLVRIDGTAFQGFFGQMQSVPLRNMNSYFSVVLIVLVSFNLTGMYASCTECLGRYFDMSAVEFQGAPASHPEALSRGKQLVNQELQRIVLDRRDGVKAQEVELQVQSGPSCPVISESASTTSTVETAGVGGGGSPAGGASPMLAAKDHQR